MPVSVVVGGQFGSEGKGKVALELSRQTRAAAVVRPGGTNSGHTGVASDGQMHALRQLPAAALTQDAFVILPPGALIDIDLLNQEIEQVGLAPERLKISPMATVISDEDRQAEQDGGLIEAIGSTGSGTGAALQRRILRQNTGAAIQAEGYPSLKPYLTDTTALIRSLLNEDKHVVVEGTQGFGLSVLHGGFYPKATSRDTTAGAFISEAGLSPVDVTEVILVIRTFPIRVAGDSGPLENEMTWAEVAKNAELPPDFHELTSATKKIRRVGKFDPEIVRRAIAANNPTKIVLNHLDYVDPSVKTDTMCPRAVSFIEKVEREIGQPIDWIGPDPEKIVPRSDFTDHVAAADSEPARDFEMAAPAGI